MNEFPVVEAPQLVQLSPPTAVDAESMHVNFLRAAHRLGDTILAALSPKLGAVIAGHVLNGGGILRVDADCAAPATWRALFIPGEGSAAPLLANSATLHLDVKAAGVNLLAATAPFLGAALDELAGAERAAVFLALTAGTHTARAIARFGQTWSIEWVAEPVDPKGRRARFALFTEAPDRIH